MKYKNGILAGAFDLIHPGYIRMFKDAKSSCERLTVALHSDPTVERPHKMKPIQTVDERIEILEAIKYIDDIKVYTLEEEFLSLLKSNVYDVRYLGSDYKNIPYSGKDLPIKIEWIERNHHYSTTDLKNKICMAVIRRW